MNTKVRTHKKMMKGFMCHSPAATAVCMTGDHQSVIIPRRPDRRLVDRERLINSAKYTRIVEQKRRHHLASTATKRSPSITTTSVVPIFKTTSNDEAQVRKNNVPQLTLSTNVDEVQVKKENILPQLTLSTNVVQEVVMRVSLHCHGCAAKVKKLLSKMEGVTSFTVDLETKRVTVKGHVSAVRVLESISKVKKAEFWPSFP